MLAYKRGTIDSTTSIFFVANMPLTLNNVGYNQMRAGGTNENTVCVGYTNAPAGTRFLCDSEKYGRLFASDATINNHPMIEDDMLVGACCCAFITNQGFTFVVLVQKKEQSSVANPTSYRNGGESYEDCARRKTKDVTGLDVTTLQPLAEFKCDSRVWGLEWKTKTVAFYGVAECPDDWDLNEKVNRIEFTDDNEEIDFLWVINVGALDCNIGLGSHDFYLIQEAVRRLHPAKYLTSFKYL